MSDNASLMPMLAKLKALGLKHSVERRYDRCCHGGEVGLRLPLRYRLDCANGRLSHD